MNAEFWKDRRVFITGHTGFKGSWLSLWLHRLGAKVTGYALDPPSEPSLFVVAGVEKILVADYRSDIVDYECLAGAVGDSRPEIIIHMAAQSLVRESYHDPLGTYATNVMGTAHILEAARKVPDIRAVLSITTDKCYENREWVHPYRETDTLGGSDPYSSSKACAEIVTSAFRSSFFPAQDSAPGVATARAGNVIGGGDWAKDRLIPDCIRSFCDDEPVVLRYPHAVRPWQHVLEPLSGYLMLAQGLAKNPRALGSGWNFGPDPAGEATVLKVASLAVAAWGDSASVRVDPAEPELKEAGLLRLDSTKARTALGWQPRWNIDKAVAETALWYRAWHEKVDMYDFTLAQIDDYSRPTA